ncbi:hypothetical protein IKI14_07550 [bacterium]|nr:hypothetical protein [bacterium]MBR7037623.1 hypothetical protein [bacterium]
MAEYTIRSAHLANQKKDQNLSNASAFNENKINKKLPHINTIKCNMFAFLRLNKSIQNRKNIIDATIMMNWSRLKCIYYAKYINTILK